MNTYFDAHQFAKFDVLVLVAKVELLPQLGCLGLVLYTENKTTTIVKLHFVLPYAMYVDE